MCYIWRNHLDVIGAKNEAYSMFKIFYFHISLWMIVMFSLDAHMSVLLPLCNKLKLYNGQSQQSDLSAGPQLPVQLHFSVHASVWEPFPRSPFSPLWGWFPTASQSITERWPFHRMKTYVIRFQMAQMGTDRLCCFCESHIAYTVCRLHVELLAVTRSSLWDCCGKYVK